MKFSEKKLVIVSKVTENQSFTLSPKDSSLEKPKGWVKLTSPSFRVKMS